MDDDDPVPGLPEMAELLEERDAELSAHGARVAEYAERIARAMGLPAPVIGRVRVAARLHDLGKVWISRDILDKPGPLTEREWGEIRHHPRVAARLFRLADLHDLADIVACPPRAPGRLRLSGGDSLGRDAARGPDRGRGRRVRRDAVPAAVRGRRAPPEEAREELERVAATQLDANVVDAFLSVLRS